MAAGPARDLAVAEDRRRAGAALPPVVARGVVGGRGVAGGRRRRTGELVGGCAGAVTGGGTATRGCGN
jgi:hypothetical protein